MLKNKTLKVLHTFFFGSLFWAYFLPVFVVIGKKRASTMRFEAC